LNKGIEDLKKKKESDRNPGNKSTLKPNEKYRRILRQRLKSCKRNMQELNDSIKRLNLRIMVIEAEKVQVKGIDNVLNKIIAETFPSHEKELFRYSKPPGHQTDLTKIESLHSIFSVKQLAQRMEKEY
jgi:hypothetical protein